MQKANTKWQYPGNGIQQLEAKGCHFMTTTPRHSWCTVQQWVVSVFEKTLRTDNQTIYWEEILFALKRTQASWIKNKSIILFSQVEKKIKLSV